MPDCGEIDYTDCEAAGWCGDGIIQTAQGEVCDGHDSGGETCQSLGFELGGTLLCDWCQQLETSGCATSPVLIPIPAGTFQRDATVTNLSTVSAFRLGREEVTRALFEAVMGVDPSNFTAYDRKNAPVEMVSWYHAIAFCNKLSLREGLTPVYSVSGVDFSALTFAQIPTIDDAAWNSATPNWSADGYRLPTEMEWKWAAMGADSNAPGEVNTTGYMKPFAGSTGTNALADHAWYVSNSFSRTHAVGGKLANELGLFDMSGNVYEWTWDWSTSWPNGTVVDYRGSASGISRSRCGGYWSSEAMFLALDNRHNGSPTHQHAGFGFRIARQ